jgi:hypothetical protein
MDDPAKCRAPAAVLTLVGFINIPIIKFSVDWWNTLHQPASVIRMDGPTIHPSMLYPLLVMAIAYTLIFFFAAHDGHAQRDLAQAGADDAPPGRPIHRPGCVKGPLMSHEAFVFLVLCGNSGHAWRACWCTILLDGRARRRELSRTRGARRAPPLRRQAGECILMLMSRRHRMTGRLPLPAAGADGYWPFCR